MMKMTDKTMRFAGVACLATLFAVPAALAQDVAPAEAPAAPGPEAVEEVLAPVAPIAEEPLQKVVEEKPVAPAVQQPAVEPVAAVDVPEEDKLAGVKVGEAADSSRITVSLDSVEMADVIRLFTRLSGANIICNTTNLTGSVTANIENKDWKAALELILKGQNLILTEDRDEEGFYIIEPKPPKEKEPWETETFKLSYLKSAEAATILKSFLGIDDTAKSPKKTTRKTADGSEEVKMTETAVLENGRVVSYPAANIVIVSAPEYKLREVREVIRQVDVERPQVYIEAKIVEVSGSASSKIGIDWSGLLGSDYTLQFGEFSRNYSKGFDYGTKGDTTTTGEKDARTGVKEWSDSALTHAKNHTKKVTDTYRAILTAPQFGLVVNALKANDDVAQISNPKLVVANEEQAVIDMSTKDPYVKVESSKDGTGDNVSWTYSTEMDNIPMDDKKAVPYIEGAFFSYGIQVKVTPRINNPSNITVNIEPTISYLNTEKGEYYRPLQGEGSDVQTRYPIIESKRVQSIFSLGNGQTAVIGGLTKTEDREVVKKVPVLGSIPVLKYLFSHTEKVKVQTETILFVTVGIVDNQSRESVMQLPDGARLTQNRIDENGKIIDKEVEEAKAKAREEGIAVPEAVPAE